MSGAWLLRRSWIIVLMATASVAGATIVGSREPPTYTRTMQFVLTPSDAIGDVQIPDALRGSSGADSQLVYTVARVLETERFFAPAAAKVLPSADRGRYGITSSVLPGTEVIEIRLNGPGREQLMALETALRPTQTQWVADVYKAYRVEFLESKETGPSSGSALRLVALAAIAGGLMGVLLILLGARMRDPSRRLGVAGPSGAGTTLEPIEGGPPAAQRPPAREPAPLEGDAVVGDARWESHGSSA